MNIRDLKSAFEETGKEEFVAEDPVDLAEALFPGQLGSPLTTNTDRLKLVRRSPPPSPTEEVETLALLEALVAEEAEEALLATPSEATQISPAQSIDGDAHSDAGSDEALADDIFMMMVSDKESGAAKESWSVAFDAMQTPFELLAPEMLLEPPLVYEDSFSDTASLTSSAASSADTAPVEAAPPPSKTHAPAPSTVLVSKAAAAAPAPSAVALGDKSGRNAAERKEWSADEDELIRRLTEAHGCKWRVIAAELPGRSDDAVRNRWNRLKEAQNPGTSGGGAVADGTAAGARPSGRAPRGSAPADGADKPERVSWTRQEDETILASVGEFGNRWGKIAARLPGRTEHAIRNRFSRLQSLASEQAAAPELPLAPLRGAVVAF